MVRAADACNGEFFIEAAGDKDLRRGLKKAGELAATALRPGSNCWRLLGVAPSTSLS